MMYSVADIAGLNKAGDRERHAATSAWHGSTEPAGSPNRQKVVAITMFGITTPAVTWPAAGSRPKVMK